MIEDPIRHYVNANYLRPEEPDHRQIPQGFKAAYAKAVDAIRNRQEVEDTYLFDNGGKRSCKNIRLANEPVYLTEELT
jgi:hypothetical protein